MKELEISRLMDGYVDNEFFPDGVDAADVEAVKEKVLAQAAPAGKRRRPSLKVALLAAALAVGCVLCIAAGLPNIVYQLANGTLTYEQTSTSKTATLVSGPLMSREDGRIFSLLNGEHLDITDLISQDTPYINDRSDPETGMTYYIVMGGTPEHYGCFQWIVTPDPYTYEEGSPMHEGTEDGIFSTYSYRSYQWTSEDDGPWTSGGLGNGKFHWSEGKDVPAWLINAMEELDIPYEFVPKENVTTIYS